MFFQQSFHDDVMKPKKLKAATRQACNKFKFSYYISPIERNKSHQKKSGKNEEDC